MIILSFEDILKFHFIMKFFLLLNFKIQYSIEYIFFMDGSSEEKIKFKTKNW